MGDTIRTVGVALILEGPRVLVTQRRRDDSFPMSWEFPGGTCEPNETLQGCIVREMREELGVTVEVEASGPDVVYHYPDWTIRLVSFWCRITEGVPAPLEAADVRWVTAPELAQYQFPPASGPLIEAVKRRLMATPTLPPHPFPLPSGERVRGEGRVS
ncbi:MAG: (deoxy)nucleoside triphosphate pyrophosphohydrolase [Candidatus Omnitrophica bacterium]|nr:(deoxy)nucleoside triphosphate pyrophosphohydrolase [Candidatus Omnitrophota bacterium]